MNAEHYIKTLELIPHPEGGYYKETYRSSLNINTKEGKRHVSTAIYFLLPENNFSAFHKIKSDELWHFYTGDVLEVIEITTEGKLKVTELGADNFQYCVPAGNFLPPP